MSDVRELLERMASGGDVRAAPEVFQDAVRQSVPIRRRRRRGIAAVALLGALAIIGAVVVVVVVGNSDSSQTGVTSTPPPTTAVGALGPTTIELGPNIVQPAALAGRGRYVWVTGQTPGNGPAFVEELDTAAGGITGEVVTLPDNDPFALALGRGAVWVRSQQGEESTHLYKIDARHHRIVATIRFQNDGGLAVTDDAVWAIDGVGTLVRIDPKTAEVVARIPLPGGLYPPLFVSAGPRGVWLTSPYDGSILQVDTNANRLVERARAGKYAGDPVQLGDSLWVVTQDASGSSTRLSEYATPSGEYRRTVAVGDRITSLASDGHVLWVTTPDGLWRVDPATGRHTPVSLPSGTPFVTSVSADSASGDVWAITDQPSPRFIRIDTHHETSAPTGPAVARIEIDALPTLTYQAREFTTVPGINRIDFVSKGGVHILVFEDPALSYFRLTAFGPNSGNEPQRVSGKVELEAGRDYVVYCLLPGHRQAGMQAVIHVRK